MASSFILDNNPFYQHSKNQTKMNELLKSLIYIQQHLTAPKSEYNSFGKYNYRSLESILAAIKPLLRSQNCGIRFEDEVIELGG